MVLAISQGSDCGCLYTLPFSDSKSETVDIVGCNGKRGMSSEKLALVPMLRSGPLGRNPQAAWLGFVGRESWTSLYLRTSLPFISQHDGCSVPVTMRLKYLNHDSSHLRSEAVGNLTCSYFYNSLHDGISCLSELCQGTLL